MNKGSNVFDLLLYLFIIFKKKGFLSKNNYKLRVREVRFGNELRTLRGSIELI
jgi:hypothetical protein